MQISFLIAKRTVARSQKTRGSNPPLAIDTTLIKLNHDRSYFNSHFYMQNIFGASRVADFASKEHTRPSITANRKLKNQYRILRSKATEATAYISRKEVTVHTIQHKQLPDKSPVFRLFISFPWIHIIPIIYIISMNSYYTCKTYTETPPISPWTKTAIERDFSIKRKHQTKITQTCHCTVPTGNSPRRLRALNRQAGSYIFDTESCSI